MHRQFSGCETTESVSVEGDIDAFFEQTEKLYHEGVSVIEDRYNSRTNWLENPIWEDIETDLPDGYVEEFLSAYVVTPFYYAISTVLKTDKTPKEWFDEHDDVGFDPDIRYIPIKESSTDELVYDEWSGPQTAVGNRFTMDLPVTKDIIEDTEKASVVINRTEDGYETVFGMLFESHNGKESASYDCINNLLSDRPKKEREALLIREFGTQGILVATGLKEVASDKTGFSHLKAIEEFPVDTICWNTEENEECEPGNIEIEYKDKTIFMYNTDALSESEMVDRLESVYEDDGATPSEFGELVGYPEHAVESFAHRQENDIPPAHDNHIKKLFAILENDESIDPKQVDYADYTEYVYDYSNLESDAKRGQRIKAVLINFSDQYNIEPRHPERFQYSDYFPSKEEIPKSFDELWHLPY